MSTQTKSITVDKSMLALRDDTDNHNVFLSLPADHGNTVYPAQTQVEYNTKCHPDAVLPEYLGLQDCIALKAICNIWRVTKSI
jgi:hypothetical protein